MASEPANNKTKKIEEVAERMVYKLPKRSITADLKIVSTWVGDKLVNSPAAYLPGGHYFGAVAMASTKNTVSPQLTRDYIAKRKAERRAVSGWVTVAATAKAGRALAATAKGVGHWKNQPRIAKGNKGGGRWS
jgi:hypothetical protein